MIGALWSTAIAAMWSLGILAGLIARSAGGGRASLAVLGGLCLLAAVSFAAIGGGILGALLWIAFAAILPWTVGDELGRLVAGRLQRRRDRRGSDLA